MLVATDLDGTFLAGEPENRLRLYQLIAGNPEIKLAFVTGRGLENVIPLLSGPTIPVPDYVICDVGGTDVEGATRQPVQPLQAEIDARWPGERTVVDAMAHFDRLERQDVPQQRRCSYFCSTDDVRYSLAGIEAVASGLGCEVLYSAERHCRQPGCSATTSGSISRARSRILSTSRAASHRSRFLKCARARRVTSHTAARSALTK